VCLCHLSGTGKHSERSSADASRNLFTRLGNANGGRIMTQERRSSCWTRKAKRRAISKRAIGSPFDSDGLSCDRRKEIFCPPGQPRGSGICPGRSLKRHRPAAAAPRLQRRSLQSRNPKKRLDPCAGNNFSNTPKMPIPWNAQMGSCCSPLPAVRPKLATCSARFPAALTSHMHLFTVTL